VQFALFLFSVRELEVWSYFFDGFSIIGDLAFDFEGGLGVFEVFEVVDAFSDGVYIETPKEAH